MINKITPVFPAKNIIANIKEIYVECEFCLKQKSRSRLRYGLMSQNEHLILYLLTPLDVSEDHVQ